MPMTLRPGRLALTTMCSRWVSRWRPRRQQRRLLVHLCDRAHTAASAMGDGRGHGNHGEPQRHRHRTGVVRVGYLAGEMVYRLDWCVVRTANGEFVIPPGTSIGPGEYLTLEPIPVGPAGWKRLLHRQAAKDAKHRQGRLPAKTRERRNGRRHKKQSRAVAGAASRGDRTALGPRPRSAVSSPLSFDD